MPENELLHKTVPKLPHKVLWQSDYARYTTSNGIYLDLFADGCNLVGPMISPDMQPAHASHIFQSHARISASYKLLEVTEMNGKVFWSNSGTEAIETAIKLCRKRFFDRHGTENTIIVHLKNGFHGRTLGSLSYSDTPFHYKHGFGPFFDSRAIEVEEDASVLDFLIDDQPVSGVILECIQGGDGDVRPLPEYWLKDIENVCKKHDVPLVCDEIQTFARTGHWCSYQMCGIKPDIVCISKGVAAGLPCGITITRQNFDNTLGYGQHFSTLGGSPFICDMVLKVIEKIELNELFSYSMQSGEQIVNDIMLNLDGITAARGQGSIWAFDTQFDAIGFAKLCLDNKLVVCGVRPTHFKIMPPLNVRRIDIDDALDIMDDAISRWYSG